MLGDRQISAQPEPVSRIEPCLLEEPSGTLLDLLTEIPAAARRQGAWLHPRTAASLAAAVRVMNCYYLDLIEGRNTRPRDIERALANDLDADEARRNLQLEARARTGYCRVLGVQVHDGPRRLSPAG